MLKPLNQSEYKHEIIKDLGIVKSGKSNYELRKAIFKCWQCSTVFESFVSIHKNKDSKCQQCKRLIHGKLGDHKTFLYQEWRNMNRRCYEKKNKSFLNYGGRGIIVCDDWKTDFSTFKKWALSVGYENGLTIERRDNNKNYTDDNCYYATRFVQARNRRKFKNNTSGYIGIKKQKNKYRAFLTVNYKRIHLGYFLTSIKAAMVRDTYILMMGLEHTLNLPHLVRKQL